MARGPFTIRVASAQGRALLLAAVGESVAMAARRSAMSHSRGGQFWPSIANSVSFQNPGGDRLRVGATHYAAAQKQFGGVIRAPGSGPGSRHAKALTIPLGEARRNAWDAADAEDAGYRLFREGDTLFGRRGKTKRAKAVPLFLLRRQVRQKAEPWFPAGAALKAAVAEGIRLYESRNGGIR